MISQTRPFQFCFCAAVCAGWVALAANAGDKARPGERFYMFGLGVDDQPVAATVQGDLRIRSTDMPCVNCHRRSGLGSVEGSVTVPPIAGDVLFQPVTVGRAEMGSVRTTGAGTRPAYDDRTLARALRDGIDPGGRSLSALMPRYAVSGSDVTALGGYLRLLSGESQPGVTDSTIHLATIVDARVSAGRRASMLDVLREDVRDKNAGTRHETRRRERGPWDMRQHYENYRGWVLHEWELRGPAGEWGGQLEELYRRQPVFAVVSAIADDDWSPVHEFAARLKLPVILPQTPLPPTEPGDAFYSLYFSKGVALEAQALAQHLGQQRTPPRLVQVSRCDAAGRAATVALLKSLTPASSIRSECLDGSTTLSGARWRELIRGDIGGVVLWLGSEDVSRLETVLTESTSSPNDVDLYLSSSLLGDQALSIARTLGPRAALLHPFAVPDEFARHAWRSLAWFKAKGIVASDQYVAVNTLFAATLVADALGIPRTLTSREYFVERIEHMTRRSPTPSAYPGVSFDATRRFASIGCYILRAPASPGGPFTKVEPWFVPES